MSERRWPGVAVLAWLLIASLLGGCAWIGFTETPDSLLKDGQKLYLARRYDEAIIKLERVVELDNTRWLAYLYLARCYMAKGSWTVAISDARLAYETDPDAEDVEETLSTALLAGGESALRTERFTLALTDFTEYASLHPNDPRGYLGIGRADIGAGRYTSALDAFTRGIQNDRIGAVKHDLLQGLLDGGIRALSHGKAKPAVSLLQEYVNENPTNPTAYVVLAKAWLASGSGSNARQAVDRALMLDPHQPEAIALMRSLR
ncbi:MAG TPA: tetratricopeptide repeat protein [Terriglobales bacterium]|nr:tetratricopeptide repeat protein [Terriglobales bacterium]